MEEEIKENMIEGSNENFAEELIVDKRAETGDSLNERKEKLKKFFTKNNYVLTFSIIAGLVFLIMFLSYFNFPMIGFFSMGTWFFLGLMFLASAILAYFEKFKLMFIPLLIWLIFLGVSIRMLPMADHGAGTPGLWDITTNSWTLGPDLDPFLFLRTAKSIVEQGSIPAMDMMRNVPLGFDNGLETKLLPYIIVWIYKFMNVFTESSIEYAAVIFPVVMFALTIISFFLFVREIFIRKSGKSRVRAEIIALISTIFMITIPAFLSRTLAGIPEKESVAFFFMFIAFYFFLKAWKSKNIKNAIILGALAGISTAGMALVWGGVIYAFVTISLATLIAFIINMVKKKEFAAYTSWLVASLVIMILGSQKYSLISLMGSTYTIISFLTLFTIIVHFILWKTKLSEMKILTKYKIPKTIISLVISIVVGIVLMSLLLRDFTFIFDKVHSVVDTFINPVTGRWGVTVAENRQPYFNEWGGSFGPFIKKFPVMFWLFFIGSVVLFKKMLNKIKRNDAWILTGLYVLALVGLVFSRYSNVSIFNGVNFISKLFYFGSAFLLIGGFIYYYIKNYRKEENDFEKIDYEFLFLFSLFVLCLFSVRGAVRLILILAPIAPIFVGYLIVESGRVFLKMNDDTWKVILGIFIVLILIMSLFTFWTYYNTVKAQSYAMVPSAYTFQWQKAMKWVRDETPKDAVFGHWWDYGYWVQTMGERATVLDGGNAIGWWNYLMGRLVLTGDNQKDALDYLYAHDTTHLLIDSSDIGKYSAYSSIGSDKTLDRFSWIPVMVLDTAQTYETRNGTMKVYKGGQGVDEDIIYNLDGKEIFLPAQSAGIVGVLLEIINNEENGAFKQPIAVFYYQGNQYKIPMRYIYYKGELHDFKEGLEGVISIVQKIDSTEQGLQMDEFGSIIYISPRVLRGMMAQKYLLNDAFGNFPNFELVHSEPNIIVDDLRSQGLQLDDFVYFQGIQGPIKIWEINYPAGMEVNETYLDTDYSKYLDWIL